jgi:phosphoribosylglycinamide formyltransferase-1
MLPRLLLMASGRSRGSNMRAILRATVEGRLEATVAAAILTRADSPSFAMLRTDGVTTLLISPKEFGDRYAEALENALDVVAPDLICLCGYMRLLAPAIVRRYKRRILNIHPALLPKYGGPGMYGERVHEAVLASGDTESGCTVHYVDEEYDHGDVLLQRRVPVEPGDTPETLAARVLPLEHETYAQAIGMALRRLGGKASEP